MKIRLLILGVAVLSIATCASATNFTQCPAVQNDTNGCELLITVTAVNGAGVATAFTVTTASPDQGPFDGVEDTLIGIQNNSGSTLTSVTVTGPAGIFSFDNDGACDGSYSPEPTMAQCGGAYTTTDPTDYQSAGATFSGINLNQSSGTINVSLANGASTWFDLEGQIAATQIIAPVGPTATPEPATLLLFGTGLAALGARLRKRLS